MTMTPETRVERRTMTIPELARRNELPVTVVRIGRRLLVSRVQVERFLEGRTVMTPDAGSALGIR
jgi:hypothetical protein